MAMSSHNPVFSRTRLEAGVSTEPMTLAGTVRKTFLLLAIVVVAAAWTWMRVARSGGGGDVGTLILVGAVGGLGLGFWTSFHPQQARITAPIYAALEGLLLGAISALANARYAGLPMQAVLLTVATLGVMLIGYRTGLIRATERLKTIVVSCTAAIAMFYVIALVLGAFGLSIPFLHEGGPIGIAFSLFVTGLAAFNLILDFDAIDQWVGHADEGMEWFAAFGLVVTLVWLYLEFVRLLGKLRR